MSRSALEYTAVLVVNATVPAKQFYARGQCNNIANIRSAVKNRAMNQTKIFAILIGALLGALPVRGQENVERLRAIERRRTGSGRGIDSPR